jgi:hypothetical protein
MMAIRRGVSRAGVIVSATICAAQKKVVSRTLEEFSGTYTEHPLTQLDCQCSGLSPSIEDILARFTRPNAAAFAGLR